MFLYNKNGNYIIEVSQGTEEEIKTQYGNDIFILDDYIGEVGIVENGKIRGETRLDRIKANKEQLNVGEYIKDNEVITTEKPNNFHFWDNIKNEWIYDISLEISVLEEELGTLELDIFNKQNEIKELKTAGRTFAAKKLEKEVAELDKKYQKKIDRYEELEG